MSTNARLRGAALQRMRAAKRAENPLCVLCLDLGILREWTELDHKVPVEKGGTDDWDNLQGLCTPCHERKTARDRGHKVRSDADAEGLPTNPAHPWYRGEG